MNKYIPIDYATDIDEGVSDCTHYGNTVFSPCVRWSNNSRTYLIISDAKEDMDELTKKLRIGKKESETNTSELTNMIIEYWDLFI